MTRHPILELVCPAGTPAALRAAIAAGADVVYCGFDDETNARNFPGLNFSRQELAAAVAHAHASDAKVFLAINTFPRAGDLQPWHRAVHDGAMIGVDAFILADMGLLAYAAEHYPRIRRHLSVQAAASNADAIKFYTNNFGVRRVVLPRVLTVTEIAAINKEIECETEVFVYGGLCVMAEGRCSLSSYITGQSPNIDGVCSPASHVSYLESGKNVTSMLGGFAIQQTNRKDFWPYPTICKGCFSVEGKKSHVFEDAASLDASSLIPQLAGAGVTALKIEGRQRSRAYVSTVVRSFRRALDNYAVGLPIGTKGLARLSEGQVTTEGAYRKVWR